MRAALAKLQKEYLIDMEDVVVVTKDDKDKVKLHQAVNLTATGAVGGTFWGSLIGLIFLNPLLGAAVGAGAGAVSGKLSDIGISDKFMKELGETLTQGHSGQSAGRVERVQGQNHSDIFDQGQRGRIEGSVGGLRFQEDGGFPPSPQTGSSTGFRFFVCFS
jgi:hypothetical protein